MVVVCVVAIDFGVVEADIVIEVAVVVEVVEVVVDFVVFTMRNKQKYLSFLT